jgi:acyl-CoA synthetase (AMP-forming)/AMP-acid ligase II
MSKGAIGVEPYWPEGILRYLAAPSIPTEEAFVRRPAARSPHSVALREGDRALTYGEMAAAVEARAATLMSTPGEGKRIALVLNQRLEETVWALAALWARYHVYPVLSSLPQEALRRSLERFQPDLIIVDERADMRALAPWQDRLLPLGDVKAEGRAPRRPGEGYLYLADEEGTLFMFGGRALLSMALSWATYLDFKVGSVLQVEPLGTWEGLCSVLPALFRGATVLQADVTDGRLSPLREWGAYYTIASWQWGQYLAESLPRGTVQAIYLSVRDAPSSRLYRRLANLFSPSPLLMVFGLPETGPVAAHHPSWFLEDSIGLPITNVDIWPLNPETGEPLDLAWEALEYGELGVKSPMVAGASLPEEAWRERKRGDWVRTHRLIQLDANGFLYLLPYAVRAP